MSAKNIHVETKAYRKAMRTPDFRSIALPETDEEAIAIIEEANDAFNRMIAKLRDAVPAGRNNAKRMARSILNTDAAKVAAFSHAVTHFKTRPFKPGEVRLTVGGALKLDMWEDSGTKVRRGPLADSSREVYRFSVAEYARQYLAMRVSEPLAELHPRQFARQGGMPRLNAWMIDTLKSRRWSVRTTDVPNCFGVLNRELVEAGLPLPRQVTRSVLFSPMDRAVHYGLSGEVLVSVTNTAPGYDCGSPCDWGIPVGSALSPLAAEAILAPILYAVEAAVPGVLAASYADDIVIFAPSSKAADASFEALCAAATPSVGEHAVYGLRSRKASTTGSKGVAFAGSIYRKRKGNVRRRLHPGAVENYAARLATELHHKTRTKESASRSLQSWVRQNEFDPYAVLTASQLSKEWGLKIKI